MSNKLSEKYRKEITPALREKFGYKNIYAVPKIEKIVINSGVGKIVNTRKAKVTAQSELGVIEDIIKEFALITGQNPQVIRARKSISTFKLRKGMVSGIRVTLRGEKMYDFLSRLIDVAFPRTRDFRGIEEKSVDSSGNLSMGIREQIVFPEIPHDKVQYIWGMQVTVVTSAGRREEALELFRQVGVPFSKQT